MDNLVPVKYVSEILGKDGTVFSGFLNIILSIVNTLKIQSVLLQRPFGLQLKSEPSLFVSQLTLISKRESAGSPLQTRVKRKRKQNMTCKDFLTGVF